MSVSPIAQAHSALEPEEVLAQAREFFALPELRAVADQQRLSDVAAEINESGSYRHTAVELLAGAKLAWRNHARCAGRYNWRSLRLVDLRDRTSPDEIAEGCFEHLRVSTNAGKLRSVITVFDQARPGQAGPRIHNPQLVRYAGYRTADGIVGDPLHLELTAFAQSRGWVGEGTAFDVLPLMVSVNGSEPVLYDVPRDAVLEVPIEHPEFDWFKELELRWHANPAISNLCLEIGGIQYPAAPFSGWYVSSEIGARNLSDTDRYDMLPAIAQRMGLATRRNASLWKDRALVELNRAVLWSYEKSGVYIVDHHTAAAQFITHVDRESNAGRVVSADWAWVNPPLSASTTATYHRTFEPPDFSLRPNFYPLAPELGPGFAGAPGPAELSAADGGCPWSGDSSGEASVAAIGSAGNQ